MKARSKHIINNEVLIVDDYKPNLELLVKILQISGYQVRSSNNAESALLSIAESLPALILLDVKMPGMDGFELCQKLKSDKRTHDIPIIFISAYGDDLSKIRGFQVGGIDFINKPFNTGEVLARVGAHMELRKMQITQEYQNEQLKAEIARHERAEKALKQSEEKYRNIFNNALDILYRIKIEGTIEEISPSVNHILGYTKEELIGKSILKLYFDNQDREALLKAIIESKEIKDYELRLKTKSGELKFVALNSRLITDSKGKPSHIDGIMRDMTDVKRMTADLIYAKEKAEESDRLKTAFLHNISHEIRTPLNAIRGFSELLSDPAILKEESKEYSEIIIESSDRLLSLITEIINISSLETGQEKIVENEVNLNSIFDVIEEQFLSKGQKENIAIRSEPGLPNREAGIITDETKLIQILSKLVGNALKFTKEGYVEFGYSVKGDELEFYVKDTGIGISESDRKVIFERFHQGESSMNRQYGGSGLGLAISKAYSELLGGRMWMTSEPGVGSVFYFTIPYKKVSRKITEIDELSNSVQNNTKNSKILLVAEDEDLNFLLVQKLLSGLNYVIIRAKDGKEVVDLCSSDMAIDLVLMDIKMPYLNGYDATTKIKQGRPGLPVIALTAYSSDEDKQKAISCGCSDFITKPFRREELITKIELYLK